VTTKAEDPTITTTNGQPPAPGYEDAPVPQPYREDGQAGAYWVLSEEERKKGWVRPLRRSYIHDKCGGVTTMGLALCETYARDPSFYGSTFCCICGAHFPVSEFMWDGTNDRVGS
jgi:hypothetical protein